MKTKCQKKKFETINVDTCRIDHLVFFYCNNNNNNIILNGIVFVVVFMIVQ